MNEITKNLSKEAYTSLKGVVEKLGYINIYDNLERVAHDLAGMVRGDDFSGETNVGVINDFTLYQAGDLANKIFDFLEQNNPYENINFKYPRV